MASEDKIEKFLKDKLVLIATDNTTDRTSWKKIFHEKGVQTKNFLNAKSIEEAVEVIEKNDVNIIFCAYTFDDRPSIEILDAHTAKFPDRTEHLFYMVSERNSLAVAACAAEHEVDSLLIKPYNLKVLIGEIDAGINARLALTKEEKFYYKICADLTFKNLENAKEKIEKFIESKPDSPLPLFIEGKYFIKNEQPKLAIESWKKALSIEPFHHKTLCHIFDTLVMIKDFEIASEYAETLCDKFPINPERIPNFIRVSLANKNYQSLIDFCEMILEVESDLLSIRRPIAAALAVCAKNLAGDDKFYEIVKSSSLKAMELTDMDSQIYYTCLENLVVAGDLMGAKKGLDAVPTDEHSNSMRILELRILELEGNSDLVYASAQNLIKVDIKDSEVYIMLLKASIAIEKNTAFIDDLKHEIVKLYPKLKEFVDKLA
jgi:tetratricopeptide (TPR) repeat protein